MKLVGLKELAVKKGWFEALEQGKNVRFKVKDTTPLKGLLTEVRKVFPDNYVTREGYIFTIYGGDKEATKMLLQPLGRTLGVSSHTSIRKSLLKMIEKSEKK